MVNEGRNVPVAGWWVSLDADYRDRGLARSLVTGETWTGHGEEPRRWRGAGRRHGGTAATISGVLRSGRPCMISATIRSGPTPFRHSSWDSQLGSAERRRTDFSG